MAVLLQTTLLLILAAFSAAQTAGRNLGPTYMLNITITVDNSADRQVKNFSATAGTFSDVPYYEWESYDGWFNNPAHPEWGGAGKP